MAANMPDGFWQAALRYGGVATLVLFVLWSLYGTILNKIVLTILGEDNTMIFMVLITVLIFIVTIFGLWLWYLNNCNTIGNKSISETNINFEVPHEWTFHMTATALAKTDQAAVQFEGFQDTELKAVMTAQKLSTRTTKAALEQLNKLARTPIRPYHVVRHDGFYQLTVR